MSQTTGGERRNRKKWSFGHFAQSISFFSFLVRREKDNGDYDKKVMYMRATGREF
jgi:hypothetical protein